MQLVKKLEPEEIAYKLQQFDPGICTQVFLSELKRVLPSPEEVSVFFLTLNNLFYAQNHRLVN
jgi:hypothetical protein